VSRKLAVIIPMYNEEGNAEKCIREVCSVLNKKLPEVKLIVVNDGSKDKTEDILKSLDAEDLPFSFVSHPLNKGYGAGLITGAKEALSQGYEFGLFMDSDLTNDPEIIPEFASKIASGSYDLVKASRYISGGGMEGVPFKRRIITITGNFVASFLFGMGIKDCTNGFHAVRLELIVDIDFKERGFPFLLEELYYLKKKGVRATEIPYVLTSRGADEGVSSFSYTPELIWKYLKYALLASFA